MFLSVCLCVCCGEGIYVAVCSELRELCALPVSGVLAAHQQSLHFTVVTREKGARGVHECA